MKLFKIILEKNPQILEQQLQDRLNEGWQLHGSMTVLKNERDWDGYKDYTGFILVQAIIKEIQE